MNTQEAFLRKLLNDPKLLKEIEKMVSLTKQKEAKKKKEEKLGQARYVNKLLITCKLCGHIESVFCRMDWDSSEKLYRIGCYSTDNLWPDLPVYGLTQRKPSCKLCFTNLTELDKETLINKIIVFANRH